MSEDSNSGPNILSILIVLVVLAMCGFVAWSYYHYSEALLKASILITAVSILFAWLIVFEIDDRWGIRWWLNEGPQFIAAHLCLLLIWRVKYRLAQEIITQTEQTISRHQLSFVDALPTQPAMSFAHFLGVAFIILCQISCLLAFSSKYMEQRKGSSPAVLNFFSNYAVVTILIWLFAALLVLG